MQNEIADKQNVIEKFEEVGKLKDAMKMDKKKMQPRSKTPEINDDDDVVIVENHRADRYVEDDRNY